MLEFIGWTIFIIAVFEVVYQYVKMRDEDGDNEDYVGYDESDY